jgi:hypothetical protein
MYIISMNRSRNRKDVYYLNQIWERLLESDGPNPVIDKNTIIYERTNDKTMHCEVPRDERYVHYLGTRYPKLDRLAEEYLDSIHYLLANPYRKHTEIPDISGILMNQ